MRTMPFEVYCDGNTPGGCPFENLARKELQVLAKKHGIKANQKSSFIISALRKINNIVQPTRTAANSKTKYEPINDENSNPNKMACKKETKLALLGDKNKATLLNISKTNQLKPMKSVVEDALEVPIEVHSPIFEPLDFNLKVPENLVQDNASSFEATETTDNIEIRDVFADEVEDICVQAVKSTLQTALGSDMVDETKLPSEVNEKIRILALSIIAEAAAVGASRLKEAEEVQANKAIVSKAVQEAAAVGESRLKEAEEVEANKAIVSKAVQEAAAVGESRLKEAEEVEANKAIVSKAVQEAAAVGESRLKEAEEVEATKAIVSKAVQEAAAVGESRLKEAEEVKRNKSIISSVVQQAANVAQERIRETESILRPVIGSKRKFAKGDQSQLQPKRKRRVRSKRKAVIDNTVDHSDEMKERFSSVVMDMMVVIKQKVSETLTNPMQSKAYYPEDVENTTEPDSTQEESCNKKDVGFEKHKSMFLAICLEAAAAAAVRSHKEGKSEKVGARPTALQNKMTEIENGMRKQRELRKKLVEIRARRKRLREEMETNNVDVIETLSKLKDIETPSKKRRLTVSSTDSDQGDEGFAREVLAIDVNSGKENVPTVKSTAESILQRSNKRRYPFGDLSENPRSGKLRVVESGDIHASCNETNEKMS